MTMSATPISSSATSHQAPINTLAIAVEETKSRYDAEKTPESSPSDEVAVNRKVPMIAWFLGAIASIGGFMFGYESGEISGKKYVYSSRI